MKAAPLFRAQIADRVTALGSLGLQPFVELHLFGLDDVFGPRCGEVVENCRAFQETVFIVHYPIYDTATGYIYDPFNGEAEGFEKALRFARDIGSHVLVMHRCFGFDRGLGKEEAGARFLENVARWDCLARESGVKILYENYGFVWLKKGLGKDYVTSPLDHFFPWDMREFCLKAQRMGLQNTGVLLDFAHAALSTNMFNMLKGQPHLRFDARFANIYPEDLERAELLTVSDFALDFIDYFHVSDALVWDGADGLDRIDRFLCTENLPIGQGNIDYRGILSRIKGDKTLIMEIDPEEGDHTHNVSQLRGVQWFKKNVEEISLCA